MLFAFTINRNALTSKVPSSKYRCVIDNFLLKKSQSREYINNICNDMENPFQFACQKRINQLNYKSYVI